MPEFFPGGHAYAMLADESPPADDDPVRMGLLLQRGNIAYPGHAHDAEEFYFILSGEANWRIDAQEFTARPGDLIHHALAPFTQCRRDQHRCLRCGSGGATLRVVSV